jgi:hypothetical protein
VPTNLPAAALDALEWLEWFERFIEANKQKHVQPVAEYEKRLQRAKRALKKHLKPHLPHENVK